jgi:hypothetical protein
MWKAIAEVRLQIAEVSSFQTTRAGAPAATQAFAFRSAFVIHSG